MSRLIVFGCSSTYGQGLEDCPTGEEPPSKLAWPYIVAEKLKLECVNTSTCGAPNKKILLQILEFPFQKDDRVIVLWSFHHRGYIFQNSKKAEIMSINKESSKDFYMLHTEYDMCVDMSLYMDHAEKYLDSQSIKNSHFYFDLTMYSHVSSKKNIINVNAKYVSYPDLQVDRAMDKIHIGPKSHQNVAGYILNKVVNVA